MKIDKVNTLYSVKSVKTVEKFGTIRDKCVPITGLHVGKALPPSQVIQRKQVAAIEMFHHLGL